MSRATQDTAWPRRASHTGLSPAAVPLSRGFCSHSDVPRRGPTTPPVHRYTNGLGSSPVARHYWGNHCCFLLLRVLRCFSSPGSPPDKEHRDVRKNADGLSHSEIPGSQIICIYTGLFAAFHVLHRLREPRHPPCALTYFRQTVTNQHWQLSIVNYQFITSSYLQLLISFLYLQSCLCQYVKELSSVSNYR